MDEQEVPVDEDYLGNIERIVTARLDIGPFMTGRLVGEVRRLREEVAFFRQAALAVQRRMETLEGEVARLRRLLADRHHNSHYP